MPALHGLYFMQNTIHVTSTPRMITTRVHRPIDSVFNMPMKTRKKTFVTFYIKPKTFSKQQNMGWIMWIAEDHYDIIKWEHLSRYWHFVRGIHRWSEGYPHEGQWCGALLFSLIYAWIKDVLDCDSVVIFAHLGIYVHLNKKTNVTCFLRIYFHTKRSILASISINLFKVFIVL